MKKETRKKFEEYMDSRPEQSLFEIIYSLTRKMSVKFPNGLKLSKQFENGNHVGDEGQVSDDEMLELISQTMGDNKEIITYRPADDTDRQNRSDEIVHGHVEVRRNVRKSADFTIDEESKIAIMVREIQTTDGGDVTAFTRVLSFPDDSHPVWQEDVMNTVFDGLEKDNNGKIVKHEVMYDTVRTINHPTVYDDYESKELDVEYV